MRILYPQLFEPVSQSPETVTVDRWAQPASQPTRRQATQQPAGLVAPIVTTTVETVTVDKWFQSAAQPTRRTPAQQAMGVSAPLSQSPETVTADRWVQPASQPTRRIPPTGAASSSGLIAPPKQPTTWNANDTAGPIVLSNGNLTATATSTASQGVRSTSAKTGGKVYVEFTLSTLVANTSNAVVGIADRTAPLNAGGQLGADADSMGFYPSNPAQSTYVNAVPLNSILANVSGTVIVGMAVDFTTSPPTLYVTDQTMQAAGLPWNNLANANPVTSAQGTLLTGLAAGPYYAAFNDAGDTPGIVCTANFGASPFTYVIPFGYSSWDGQQAGVSEIILTDKWVQPPTQPVRRKPTQQPSGAVGPLSQSPETVTADRWAQPASQPTRRRATQQPAGASAPVAPVVTSEIITPDKWFQPAQQPTRRVPTQQPTGGVGPLSQSPEVVTADRWAQPLSQPTRRIPTQQPAGAFAPIVTTGEIILLDKWFQPASQPVRRVKNHATMANGFTTEYLPINNPTPPASQRRVWVSWLD